jgi:hypothetical protein
MDDMASWQVGNHDLLTYLGRRIRFAKKIPEFQFRLLPGRIGTQLVTACEIAP